jgi:antirestriction protein ArdC
VAELDSAFLAADLELTPEVRDDDHAGYIASWLQVLDRQVRDLLRGGARAARS